mmetsp:Transcript_21246/g.54756  ORF Transcript_21246/g.54756 Transcript_21246/m.54756 type:complete len:211 (-) Transcript_21246:1013-1645(-)
MQGSMLLACCWGGTAGHHVHRHGTRAAGDAVLVRRASQTKAASVAASTPLPPPKPSPSCSSWLTTPALSQADWLGTPSLAAACSCARVSSTSGPPNAFGSCGESGVLTSGVAEMCMLCCTCMNASATCETLASVGVDTFELPRTCRYIEERAKRPAASRASGSISGTPRTGMAGMPSPSVGLGIFVPSAPTLDAPPIVGAPTAKPRLGEG